MNQINKVYIQQMFPDNSFFSDSKINFRPSSIYVPVLRSWVRSQHPSALVESEGWQMKQC
jgi:hypothetical protein